MRGIFLPLILFITNYSQAQTFSVGFREYGLIAGLTCNFSVNVEGVSDDSIQVKTSYGSVSRITGNQFSFLSDSTGSTIITIYANIGDSIRKIGTVRKYVKPLPNPRVTASSLIPGNVSITDFIQTERLLPDMNVPGLILCGVQPKIKSYDVYITTQELPDSCFVYHHIGSEYNMAFGSTFKYLTAGDRIVFANIKASTAEGITTLQPIQYTLTD